MGLRDWLRQRDRPQADPTTDRDDEPREPEDRDDEEEDLDADDEDPTVYPLW